MQPHSLLKLDELWTAYPGLVLVHLVRNPLDLLAGATRRNRGRALRWVVPRGVVVVDGVIGLSL